MTKGIQPTGETALDRKQMQWQQDAAWLTEWFKHASPAAPFFNVETFFPELIEEGDPNPAPFHIIIGNPPYGGTKITNDVKKAHRLGSKDPYGAFIARFMGASNRASPLAEDGVLAYIVSDTFMTIKTHRPLREQMLEHRIHKMIRVAGDTFKATVNCAVILCQRGTAPDSHTCLMADLTNLSIHEHFERFLHILYQTEGGGVISHRQNISNQTYAIFYFRQSLIKTNSKCPFFVASPKLFALMNDTTAPVRYETIAGRSVPVRTVSLNGKAVRLVKLGDIAEVKQGLATGYNKAYLFQNPKARGSYRSIEEYMKFLLTEEDLERIRSDETLRLDVIYRGISKSDTQSSRYFGGRYIVPYDKGGESKSDEGWMPNYRVPTDYFIDWSEWALNAIKTVSIAEIYKRKGKSVPSEKPYYKTTVAGVIRNARLLFSKEVSRFPDTGFYAPTFRLNSAGTFDVMGMTLFSEADAEQLLAAFSLRRLQDILSRISLIQRYHTQVEGCSNLFHFPSDNINRSEDQGSCSKNC